MATTDARTGFRLPWSADRSDTDQPEQSTPDAEARATEPTPDVRVDPMTGSGWPEADRQGPARPEPAPATTTPPVAGTGPAAASASAGHTSPATAAPRKQNRLMADLSRAMQAAAEVARQESLGRLQADAKAHVEGIHAESATQSAELRRRADEDIAGIRDWSKTEIARIREETEQRMTARKAGLELEIEDHAARLERRIEGIQAQVVAFEAEMSAFFEGIATEDDPTRLAALAENLPEPPLFDGGLHDDLLEVATGDPTVALEAPSHDEPGPGAIARPVALAAAQPAAEAAPEESELDPASIDSTDDPRLTALGLMDESAARAEAEAALIEFDPSDGIPTIEDDAFAAPLAGLAAADATAPLAESATTRVIVLGLVSVASIASFKRHLGRLPGVRSVSVSSGPDGEFIFAVSHGAEVVLDQVVPALPGFGARVTESTADSLTVTARDPETVS